MKKTTALGLFKNDLDVELLTSLFSSCDVVLIKKLSNNDRDWSFLDNKHQAGVYIPKDHRDGSFFPPLRKKSRDNASAEEINEAFFRTIWPQHGNIEKTTRLVNYRSKGEETHLTKLPKEAFSSLSPASYLVIGRIINSGEFLYQCLTIDSRFEEANYLIDLFELDAHFLIGEFSPSKIKAKERDEIFDFADEVIYAWKSGNLPMFATERARLPETAVLAKMARDVFLKSNGLKDINPFTLDAPGDVLLEISRNIEWNIFREYQRRERSVELVRSIIGDVPRKLNSKDIIREIVYRFQEIDAIMLSASQQRKSRAGYSYEHHIEAMLNDGGIPFQKQVVIESRKRPDFIIPSLKHVASKVREPHKGFILSAKTTLKERWKQVEREMKSRSLYLTTVDDNIAGNAIEDMDAMGIKLVVPESLRESKETEYKGHDNVLGFKQLCELKIKPNLEYWSTRKKK